MSQEFKLKFDRLRDNDPTIPQGDDQVSSDQDEIYPSASNTRTLALIWPQGNRMFLNYAYLVSGDYTPADNRIVLIFTSHRITLTGSRLGSLFELLMVQSVKRITCSDSRYAGLQADGYSVFEIAAEATN